MENSWNNVELEGQINIFDILGEKLEDLNLKDKHIRLIELFGGVGSQAAAIKWFIDKFLDESSKYDCVLAEEYAEEVEK